LDDLEALAKLAVDCAFKLHADLGPGLLESAYEAFLEASLQSEGLQVERQKSISAAHNGLIIPDAFRLDLFVEQKLIIEIKSVERLAPVHSKQVLTYLRLTGCPLGLLMNFGEAYFKDGVKRVIDSRNDYMAPKR
jgi:GxxExxY protein